MPRNITLSLDEDILRSARVAAARRGLSLSALLREELTKLAEEDERYDVSRRNALEWMRARANLGSGELPRREELHDRDALR